MRAQSSPNRHPWLGAVSDVLDSVDSAEFCGELVRVLRTFLPLDRALVYVVRRDEAPIMLHADQPAGNAAERRATALYFGGGYRFDPYYRAFLAGTAGGFNTDADEPGVSQRWDRVQHVAYLSPVSKDACVVALLVRTPGSRIFACEELERLRALETVMTAALRLHWKTWAARQALPASGLGGALHGQVEAELDRFGSATLTPREGQVVRLLLRGHSTRAAAERLGIAVATTALHRKRAYAKLGVCSQAELFYLFIRSLAMPRVRRPDVAAEPARAARPRAALVQPAWGRAAVSGAS